MRILHVLDHSLPYFSGYSFRSQYILRAQQQLGLEVFAVTSPKHEQFAKAVETLDGVEYHRTNWPALSKVQMLPMARQVATIATLAKEIKRLAIEFNANLIHAHSPSLCGLAASQAARALKLPMVYEVRYYEEDAAVDRGKTRHNSLRYRLGQRAELETLQQASAVTTISQALNGDLVQRGVAAKKIFVVPNGVDLERFYPVERDPELARQYGLQDQLVIGFIGSFYFYEGLDTLIDAVMILLAHRRDIKLLLIGEGEADAMLRQRIPRRWRDQVVFSGNVSHDEISRHYSVMDILVYPRRRSRLTELTMPLKPLEAMAMGKAVVASDLGGLREALDDGRAGYLVEADNAEALAERLWWLAEHELERQQMGLQAREFVVQQRDWRRVAERYFAAYDHAQYKA